MTDSTPPSDNLPATPQNTPPAHSKSASEINASAGTPLSKYWGWQRWLSITAFAGTTSAATAFAVLGSHMYYKLFTKALSDSPPSLDWHLLYLPPAGLILASVVLFSVLARRYRLENPSSPPPPKAPPASEPSNALVELAEQLKEIIRLFKRD